MMKRRTGLIIAAALTAFILVFVGAVVRQFTTDSSIPAQAAVPEVAASQPQPAAAPFAPMIAPDSTSPSAAAPSASTQDYPVSPEQAAQLATTVAPPSAQVVRTPELVDYNGTVAYEVPFDGGNVYVDVTSGQILGSTLPTRARGGEHEQHEHEQYEHE